MRSRAVSLPALCSFSRRSAPPPASASSLRRRNSCRRSAADFVMGARMFFSAKRTSVRRQILCAKYSHSEMRGNPDCAEQQDDSEQQLGPNGRDSIRRGLNGSHVFGGNHESVHSRKGLRDREDHYKSGGQHHFHMRLRPFTIRRDENSAEFRESVEVWPSRRSP